MSPGWGGGQCRTPLPRGQLSVKQVPSPPPGPVLAGSWAQLLRLVGPDGLPQPGWGCGPGLRGGPPVVSTTPSMWTLAQVQLGARPVGSLPSGPGCVHLASPPAPLREGGSRARVPAWAAQL